MLYDMLCTLFVGKLYVFRMNYSIKSKSFVDKMGLRRCGCLIALFNHIYSYNVIILIVL